MSNIEVSKPIEKAWKPNSKSQAAYLGLDSSIFEAFYGGTVRCGKTEAQLMYPLLRGNMDDPSFICSIFRRTFPELEESVIHRSQTGIGKTNKKPGFTYYDLGYTYNSSQHVWRAPSGAQIRFLYSDKEQDVYHHDTTQFQMLLFDELTHMTHFQYTYLTHRCRGSNAMVRSTGTPGGEGNTWVRRRFIEPAKLGYTRVKVIYDDEDKSSTYLIFIPGLPTDNTDAMEDDPTYLQRLNILEEAERKAKLGDWWAFQGQVFPEFRTCRHSDEPNNALHVIEPIVIPPWWPKIMAIDWGYSAMTWVGFGALAPTGQFYIFDEFTCKKRAIKDWGEEVKEKMSRIENIRARVVDPSASKTYGEEKTIKAQIEAAIGKSLEEADNDRIGGKMLIHEFLRWKEKPRMKFLAKAYDEAEAMSIYTRYGEKAYREYLLMFGEPEKEGPLPRLQIFNTCTKLIEAIPKCEYDENKIEDIREFDGDDPIDGVRYLLKAADRYYKHVVKEGDRLSKLSETIDDYKLTGDYMTLDRRLNRLERLDNEAKKGVRLFHGRRGKYTSNTPGWYNRRAPGRF